MPDAKANAGSKKKSCFVVCPIGDEGSTTRRHADWLFHEIIEHVLEAHFTNQFELIRADKIDQPGMIDAQIISHLLDDDLVIADMTELNPNVFYEIGIRHMKELPIVHIVKKGGIIPFDVKLFRAIPYDYADPTELRAARGDLQRALTAVLQPDYKPDNPVIRARGVVKLAESAAPETAVIQQQLSEISRRLSAIENDDVLSIARYGQTRADIELEKFLSKRPPGGTALIVETMDYITEAQLSSLNSYLRDVWRDASENVAIYTFGNLILIKFNDFISDTRRNSMVSAVKSHPHVKNIKIVPAQNA
ncbi:MAG: hypothetical protein E5X34_19675 [Mesorhizobium sp.]|uniref:hypothetical protein n=1 Tax=Mesorhizobium sp. TaxID=1871066 RepID=UPI001217CE4B|nr:hypothetical protein [Mesorhizobium sp.]TIR19558.1 MAG: hypothetical protein E5X34_19675 [Mesorhizobium sp.]